MQRRKVEINGQEFSVWGNAPWVVITVPKTKSIPDHYMIIEARHMSDVISGRYVVNSSSHRYNALSKPTEKGTLLPVAFVGESGKARADEICKRLNFHLD